MINDVEFKAVIRFCNRLDKFIETCERPSVKPGQPVKGNRIFIGRKVGDIPQDITRGIAA